MTNLPERLSTVGSLFDEQTLVFQDGTDEPTNRSVVISHQNALGHNHVMLDPPCTNCNTRRIAICV